MALGEDWELVHWQPYQGAHNCLNIQVQGMRLLLASAGTGILIVYTQMYRNTHMKSI